MVDRNQVASAGYAYDALGDGTGLADGTSLAYCADGSGTPSWSTTGTTTSRYNAGAGQSPRAARCVGS
ncbi:hypothetical protein [Streptomyces sp. NBC_00328]|uniref:hypothetical protein n=1 Tax=Streptomyces sp. NBC_00328 TaxID=2903646 RepID=UPI002E2ABCD2|nr:hypothetical protein [Streptomyces sp. NBC_00328]